MRSRPTDTRVRGLLIAVAFLFVATAAVSVTAVALQGSRNADAAADEIVQRIGTRTADLITGQLQPAAVSLAQMALAMDSGVGTTRASREHMLAGQLVSMPTLSGAFVALPDGSFHFVRREDSDLVVKRITLDDDGDRTVVEATLDDRLRPGEFVEIADEFDPRTRPWYREATKTPGSTVWTPPYVFFSSQQPGVTAATAVTDGSGEVRAVVGLDLTLTSLGHSVENLPIDAKAKAYLVADGLVIAAPSDQRIINADADGLTLATAADLGLEGSDTGRIATASLARDGLPEWSVVVRADDVGFIETVNRQTRLVIAAVVVAVFIGFALLVAIGLRLRRPLDELVTLADRDPLTELANRRAILHFGESALRRATIRRSEVTVAVLDVDYFKAVNDMHGHAAGDDALRRIGAGLRRHVRPTDLVGRIGGDEFVMILTDTDTDGARVALERAKDAAEAELRTTPETADCTLSVGMTARRGRRVEIEDLIAEADAELLESKRSRTNGAQDRASAAESHPS